MVRLLAICGVLCVSGATSVLAASIGPLPTAWAASGLAVTILAITGIIVVESERG